MTMTMTKPLNEIMEFDHVIWVHEDGSITDAPADIWAPSMYDGETDDERWSLMRGYSGQHSYSGPVMHDSEYIGGRMEDDIKSTPGFYVALANTYLEDDVLEGWGVAFRPE